MQYNCWRRKLTARENFLLLTCFAKTFDQNYMHIFVCKSFYENPKHINDKVVLVQIRLVSSFKMEILSKTNNKVIHFVRIVDYSKVRINAHDFFLSFFTLMRSLHWWKPRISTQMLQLYKHCLNTYLVHSYFLRVCIRKKEQDIK